MPIHGHADLSVKRPSHVLHGTLTLLTAGLWAFVWIPVTLRYNRKRREMMMLAAASGSGNGVVINNVIPSQS